MTWPERLDIILDIATRVPWEWFVAGVICGVILGVMIVGMAVVVVELEERQNRW